jgi:hypothetical protein
MRNYGRLLKPRSMQGQLTPCHGKCPIRRDVSAHPTSNWCVNSISPGQRLEKLDKLRHNS